MSLADWTAVVAIATAVLAVATFLAVRQGQKERSHIIIDRELTWRPRWRGSFAEQDHESTGDHR